MNTITHETREGGQQAVLPFIDNMRETVYQAVKASSGGLTAEEVNEATRVGLNNARSRCTEHFKDGRFVVLAKRQNKAGTRNIAVYSIRTEETK